MVGIPLLIPFRSIQEKVSPWSRQIIQDNALYSKIFSTTSTFHSHGEIWRETSLFLWWAYIIFKLHFILVSKSAPHSLQHPEWSSEIQVRLYYSPVEDPPVASHWIQNKTPSPYHGPQDPPSHVSDLISAFITTPSFPTRLNLRVVRTVLSQCLHTYHPSCLDYSLFYPNGWLLLIQLSAQMLHLKKQSSSPLFMLAAITLPYHSALFFHST